MTAHRRARRYTIRMAIFTAAALVATAIMNATATATPAVAVPPDGTTPRDAYLATHPGGTAINHTEISYSGGTFIVTVSPATGTRATADCPSGWFCFYDGVNFGYPRGRLSSCGFQDLGAWGWRNRTESVHYNAASGSASFINESGSTDTTLFQASSSRRQLATVSPNGNKADYVYRYC
jgi:hypothetical protein